MCMPMFLNWIFLVDTRSGDGIEAWVTMDEQDMALLQEDPELRAFANVNPSGGSGSSRLAAQDLMVAAELFPANDLWLRDSSKIMFNSMCKLGNSVTKRFTFTGPVIEVLRARGKGPSVKNPTRVEAVSRLVWKSAMAALEKRTMVSEGLQSSRIW
ncbi:hypothetical protein CDL15_Pgr014355 [Punica granatum]|uniref:Uncharacterized protein n=1 Tax=Punica granatum TaxID=22663 RepID=A0A218WF38_PUNGR|nr:hypothetical protein CDL15_Pgr014355 [Punica granatum]